VLRSVIGFDTLCYYGTMMTLRLFEMGLGIFPQIKQTKQATSNLLSVLNVLGGQQVVTPALHTSVGYC
jgi:hypothetical protein